MGVYIPGMEMPEISENNGISCCLYKTFGGDLRLRNNETGQSFDVVPVPPHGRLIDADALKKQGYFFPCAIGSEYAIPLRALREAPTIIPAEEETT